MSRPSPALVVAFLALVVSASGVAVAAIPAKDGDVHVCYSTKDGAVKVVDTERDRFSCPDDSKGLIVDTKPTQLTSPDGKFKVQATNSGARLVGPGGRIEVGKAKIVVAGALPVEVTGGTTLSLAGGTDVNTLAANNVNTRAGRGLNATAGGDAVLQAAGDLTVQADRNLDLLAGERARLHGRLALIEALVEFHVDAANARILSSGILDLIAVAKTTLKGAVTEIDPPPQSSSSPSSHGLTGRP